MGPTGESLADGQLRWAAIPPTRSLVQPNLIHVMVREQWLANYRGLFVRGRSQEALWISLSQPSGRGCPFPTRGARAAPF